MVDDNLVVLFENSLGIDIAEFTGDAVEFGVDLCMDDGILKEIPFVGTAFKLYSIGSKVYDKHCFGKLYSFIATINSSNCSKEDQEKRRKKFVEDKSFRKQELEYILILLDRYIGFEKTQQLAKLYLAYLDGKIDWITLTKYAEVVERFLLGDIVVLCSSEHFKTIRDEDTDTLQRLIALGLVIEAIRKSNVQEDGKRTVIIDAPEVMELRERSCKRTCFGEVLVKLISN